MSATRHRVAASAAAAALGATLVLVASAPAFATTELPVYPDDLGTVDFSNAAFDGYGAEFTALPADGSRWVLDIENRTQSGHEQTPTGLRLDGVDPSSPSWPSKIRYLYYVGSGGYPSVDSASTTLGDLVSTASWRVNYPVAGSGVAGIDFSAQKLVAGSWHKVSGFVQCVPVPTPRSTTEFVTQAQSTCRWAVNSRMVETSPGVLTYTPGQYLYTGTGGQGTQADFLAAFGGYEVVAFGPNVGRYAPLDATVVVQSLTAFDTSFSFVEAEQAPVAPPAQDSGQLETVLADQGVVPEPLGTDPDPAQPFTLTSSWTAVDGWVDVFAFSAPVHLGTAPVAFGEVTFTDLDLSGLAPGTHTLVLVGQSSGELGAYTITIPGPSLAATGSEAWAPFLAVSLAVLLAGSALLTLSLRSRRS